jgi:hypothetical protein
MIGAVAAGSKKRAGAGVDPGTDPATVASRTLILRENVGLTGDPASAWADQSGDGNNFSQGSAPSRPDVDVDGSVVFDGSSDSLAGPDGDLLITGTAGAVYVLCELTGDSAVEAKTLSSGGLIADVTGGGSGLAWGIYCRRNAGQDYIYVQHYTYGYFYTDEIAVSQNTLYLVRFRIDSNTIYLRVNGTEVSSVGTITEGAGAVSLGAAYGGTLPSKRIRYVFACNAALNATDRDGIDTWFQAQWPGVTL